MFTRAPMAAARPAAEAISGVLNRLWTDEQGSEVIEYALILGMIACASLLLVAALGSKVVQRWIRVNELLDSYV